MKKYLPKEQAEKILSKFPWASYIKYFKNDNATGIFNKNGKYQDCPELCELHGNPFKLELNETRLCSEAYYLTIEPKTWNATHEMIFEAIANGALVMIDGNVANYWDNGLDINTRSICLKPDYSKPMDQWDWAPMA